MVARHGDVVEHDRVAGDAAWQPEISASWVWASPAVEYARRDAGPRGHPVPASQPTPTELDPPDSAARAAPGADESHGIDGYRILEKIGEGGMGEVYFAEQLAPVRRRVAVKLIERGMDSQHVLGRFEHERQALALKDHPNIATVLDAGEAGDCRPYFAMEYVDGVPLTEFCDSRRLTTRERLELFIATCRGVQHAHQKGIIHRDIKPSNVLVAIQDEAPVPKIHRLRPRQGHGPRAHRGDRLHAARAVGRHPRVQEPGAGRHDRPRRRHADRRVLLGVLLYELVTGQRPFDSKELRGVSFDEMRRRIREVEPPRPSTRVSSAKTSSATAENRKTDSNALVRQLRGDLDWITMKALDKDRGRRYGSPSELADDIRRHLDVEPVLAGPPSTMYRMRKLVQRNRFAVSVAATLVLAMLAGTVGATYALIRVSRAEARAQRDARAAATARDRAERASELAEERRRRAQATSLLSASLAADGSGVPAVLRHDGFVEGVAFSPDSRKLLTTASLGEGGGWVVNLWNADGGGEPTTLKRVRYSALGAVFSPNGLLVMSRSRDHVVRIGSAGGDQEPIALRGHTFHVDDARFSTDGRLVVTASWDETARVWSTDGTGEPLILRGHADKVSSASFSPDGRYVVTASADDTARIWTSSSTASFQSCAIARWIA